MSQQSRSKSTRLLHQTERRPRPGPVEHALLAANEFIVRHYPIGALGGTPYQVTVGDRVLWIVPIMLTSPGYGPVGDIGIVVLEVTTLRVVGHTPPREVSVNFQWLKGTRAKNLRATFRRARTI